MLVNERYVNVICINLLNDSNSISSRRRQYSTRVYCRHLRVCWRVEIIATRPQQYFMRRDIFWSLCMVTRGRLAGDRNFNKYTKIHQQYRQQWCCIPSTDYDCIVNKDES